MTLPAAAPLALWASHYRNGGVSADLLMDHCGPVTLETLSLIKSAGSVELVVLAPGDLSGLNSHASAEAESGLFLRGLDLFITPPNWSAVPAVRSEQGSSRAQAERLAIEAMQGAFELFTQRPLYAVAPPVVASIEFPQHHPIALRRLFERAATMQAIADLLRRTFTNTQADPEEVAQVASKLSSAARRAFEASTVL